MAEEGFLDRPVERLLPWPQVRERTGLSRTTAWRLQNAGDFPKPVQVSPNRVGWRETEIEAWTLTRGPRRAPPPVPRSARPRPEARPPPPEPVVFDPRPPAEPVRAEPRPGRGPSRRRPPPAPGQMAFDF